MFLQHVRGTRHCESNESHMVYRG